MKNDVSKEVDVMPTIELMEYERTAYIKGMENYLQKLKQMAHGDALKESKRNLKECHIIQDNGDFTDRYSYSKLSAEQKE